MYADPDETERDATADALEAAGFAVVTAASVEEVEAALDDDVSCLVTASSFPDGDGFDVIEAVRGRYPDCACVIFTAESPSDLPRGGRDQVVEYVPRSVPNARDRLGEVVSAAVDQATQAAYPLPEDENERVAALAAYDVDELSALETFDRLTALMTTHFDIDIAFVGLVDAHEERFVACEGANWHTLAREDSICTHTILADEVMIVEDTREDPRFAGMDQLEELGIRSYAGARITDEDGNVLGAVCCIDSERRSYSQAERDDLRRFADEVADQLRLRRRLDEGDD